MEHYLLNSHLDPIYIIYKYIYLRRTYNYIGISVMIYLIMVLFRFNAIKCFIFNYSRLRITNIYYHYDKEDETQDTMHGKIYRKITRERGKIQC